MKLYDYYRSTASYRVRIALNIKQIHYDMLPVHLVNQGGEQHAPDYLKLNPQGLVPTLEENGHMITQSLAIIEYLDEICPTPPLLPKTPLARAKARSLALIIACDMHPLNNLRVLKQLRTQFNASEEQVTSWYHLWLKEGFAAIEQHLLSRSHEGPFCCGSEVSIADICLIPQVYNAKRFNFSLTPYPLINTIYNLCMTLTSFHKAAPEAC